jgi:hypothetical protein
MTANTDGPGWSGLDYDSVPRSLPLPRPDWPGSRLRIALLAGIVLAHGLAIWGLSDLMEARPVPASEEILVLDFMQDPLPPPPPITVPEPDQPTARPLQPAQQPAPRRRPRIRSQIPLQALPSPDRNAALDLYGADGRLRVPDDMLEQIDRKFGDKRVFSYQIPRMDDGRKLMERPPPVIYESTRFEQYWKPDRGLLDDLLATMVEKTTREIRVPVPGSSGSSTMVCRISLLALGGGCGVLTVGSDYVGPLDDPNTLSPEEDRQCKAWWEQIVGANTQEAWRKTRDLYEAQCRKPKLRAPAG